MTLISVWPILTTFSSLALLIIVCVCIVLGYFTSPFHVQSDDTGMYMTCVHIPLILILVTDFEIYVIVQTVNFNDEHK